MIEWELIIGANAVGCIRRRVLLYLFVSCIYCCECDQSIRDDWHTLIYSSHKVR
jgi:hypothetical protein